MQNVIWKFLFPLCCIATKHLVNIGQMLSRGIPLSEICCC